MEEHAEKRDESLTLKKSTLWKISAVVLGVLLLISIYTGGFGYGKGSTTITPTPTPTQGDNNPFPAISVDMAKLADSDAVEGKADAPVTIVEFSDYQCPFCGKFYVQTLPSIIKNYIETGKARLIYRDFPLVQIHQNAEKAAEAAECAGKQGKYFEMHNKLFENQQSLGIDNFKKFASDLGLDTGKFNSCLDSGETAAEIQKDEQDGLAVGIQGTPGFIIGKTNSNSAQVISGAYPFDAFQQVIENQLK